MTTSEELLDRLRTERKGYLLSYHEIFARIEPSLLEAYAELYRRLNLTPRTLTEFDREFIWVGLLASIHEEVGSIHIERAIVAGMSSEEMLASIRCTGFADSWPTLEFSERAWSRFIGHRTIDVYADGLGELAKGVEMRIVHLTLMNIQGQRQRREAFDYHLLAALEAGATTAQVAEALSYLLVPIGANGFLWCTDRWLELMQEHGVPEELSGIDFNTRRD